MEPMIFTYLFTINGYDVTVTIEFTIEFFPHIVVLEDSSLEPMDEALKSKEKKRNKNKIWIIYKFFYKIIYKIQIIIGK